MKNTQEFFRLGDKALTGLTQFEGAIGLTHVTVASYGPVLVDAKTKSQAFEQARFDKAKGYTVLREARSEAQDYLLSVRNYLTGFLGKNWSALWTPLGFLNNSLALPSTDAGRCQMLDKVKQYFTANPGQENAQKQYTAAQADALCTALTNAAAAIDDNKVSTRTARDARDTAQTGLKNKLQELRSELETVLDAEDPRWLKFIDRIPGDPRVPEQVTGITATAQPGGIIVVDWPDATRAARYKVLKQVVGTDPDFVLATTVDDSDAQLTGVPSGATVKLQVVPVNGVGEGAASEVIQLQAA
ncbi:MAG: fibronectin type III domain-containing protein [Verrucomicrobia bacterium]|nr:fibronectin type III domain-containing protein [Verrucomicrobiota bacterium]